jgi:hypothetical protein
MSHYRTHLRSAKGGTRLPVILAGDAAHQASPLSSLGHELGDPRTYYELSRFSRSIKRVHDSVVGLGFEGEENLTILGTGFTLSAILPARNAPERPYVLHIYSSGGCSGSPVFDAEGNVMGVVYARRNEPLENQAAVPSSQLLAVAIDRLPPEFLATLKVGEMDTLFDFLEARFGA